MTAKNHIEEWLGKKTARCYRDEWVELRRQGYTFKEIAERYSFSIARVYQLTRWSKLSREEQILEDEAWNARRSAAR